MASPEYVVLSGTQCIKYPFYHNPSIMKPVNKQANSGTCTNGGLLSAEQKSQLLSLLNKFKDEGVLEEKIRAFQSTEGKIALIGLALAHRVITSEQHKKAVVGIVATSITDSLSSLVFERKAPDGGKATMSPKELDELYHKGAGECYPGLLRVKCGIYAGNKAFLFMRIRTRDPEFDPSLSKLIGPNIKAELKSNDRGNYYELSAHSILREILPDAKSEFDHVGYEMIQLKEEIQGLGDISTTAFLRCLKDPDYRR